MATLKANAVRLPTSKYHPPYCDEVREYLAQGFSIAAFAGHIGVARETIYEWERTIPEFAQALAVARGKRVQALETGLLREDLAGPQITARIFALKNACPEEWRDRIEHTGRDGGPIQSVQLTADLTRLDATQRDELRALLQLAARTPEVK